MPPGLGADLGRPRDQHLGYWRPVFRYDENVDIRESAERIAAAITGAMRRVCAAWTARR